MVVEKKYMFQVLREKKHNKCKFTPEEDKILVSVVEKLGAKKWKLIATFIPGRTARQCRDRYANYLRPNLNFDQWTPEEDSLLLQQYYQHGPKWSKICKLFKGRSSSSLKNRWHSYFADKMKIPQRKNEPRHKNQEYGMETRLDNNGLNILVFDANSAYPQNSNSDIPLMHQNNSYPMKIDSHTAKLNSITYITNQKDKQYKNSMWGKSEYCMENWKINQNSSDYNEKDEFEIDIIDWDNEIVLYFDDENCMN